MKLSKFTVILAVLLISILAIGAVSAESVDDSDIVAVTDGDIGDIQESIDDAGAVDDLSSADTADETVGDDSGAVPTDTTNSYDLDDDSYSTYFNEDGTATDALSAMGDYTLNVGTINNKDIKIASGSSINIVGKEGAGIINNGTIVIVAGDGMAGSITISGLTFTNTNKNAIDIKDLSSKVTIKGNTMNIEGIAPEDNPYFSIYAVNANGFISGLNIEDNVISVKGNAPYSYGVQLGSYGALANPEDIVISNNNIKVDVQNCMAEGIYLDNPVNALVEANNVTVINTGDYCAYGIQVADSAQYVYYYAGYEGTLTSAKNVLIKDNYFDVSSDFMVYAVTVQDFGANGYDPDMADWGYDMPACYQFDLNTTIANNTVVAVSKKGVIGIGGQTYNMTVVGNDVTAIGTSAEGMTTGDGFGNHTSALCVQYNAANAEDDYYIVVSDNTVTTNVLAEEINSEDYRKYVTFENNVVTQTIFINDDTYSTYFNDDGTIKDDAPIAAGDILDLGDLTGKKLVIDTSLTIRGLPHKKLVNSVINLVEGADNSVIDGLTMEFTGDENSGGFAVISAFEVSNIEISNNKITIPNSKGSGYAMAIEVEGLVNGCDNVTISGNTIDFRGSTAGMYGIDVFTKWKSEALNTNIVITGNVVNIEGATGMVEPIYLSTANGAIVSDNTLTSQGGEGADAYGIGAPSANNAVFENNKIVVKGTNMAYGISNTKSENVIIRNNNISAEGTGAIAVGLSQDSNVEVSGNELSIDGGDFTTISTWDSVGTGNGAIVVKDDNTNVKSSGNDVTEVSAVRLNSTIEVSDITVTADPNGEANLPITLKTSSGMLLANQIIKVLFNNEVLNLTTDAKGVAVLPFALNKAGVYSAYIFYFGDDDYRGAEATTTITINKVKTTLTSAAKTFLATATTKKLTATLKDANGKAIAKKTVTFTVNGKTYKANTTAKGVATVKLALKAAKKYTVKIKFAGDKVYNASTKSVKVTLTKEKTKITAPKKTFKKAAKTKKVVITLKNSKGKAIAKKKITLTVNKKKYTVKTNKKGQATFKVKLTKKGTFKYTVKFAGDTQYKAVTKKTGKIVIK